MQVVPAGEKGTRQAPAYHADLQIPVSDILTDHAGDRQATSKSRSVTGMCMRSRDVHKTRRSTFKTETRRDVPKNVSIPQSRSLKTPTGEVCHVTNCFFAGYIHYFLHDISASLIYCMDVHKTKVTRPRPRRYIFKTETRPRR